MDSTRTALKTLYQELGELELEPDEFVARAKELFRDTTRSSLLRDIFIEFQNSLSYAMLANLSPLFNSVEYSDIVTAMREVSHMDLPAYHFSLYVPELFGVDIIQAARKAQERFPDERQRLAVFANLKKLIGPSTHSQEKLIDAGASPEVIREHLRRSGAPLLPLPGEM